jgi:uncharacterized membrane protein YdjX (TVP38/TMEM64 family)
MLDQLLSGLHGLLKAAAEDPSPARLLAAWGLVSLAPLALVVPMTAVCLGAALLPAGWAALVILGGVAANTALSWGLARTLFGRRWEAWLEARGGRLAAVRAGAQRSPLKWAILSRYLPAPFSAVPMALAATGVGFWTTVLGSLIGMAPWTAIYIWVVRAGREGSVGAIGQALALVVLMGLFLNWVRGRLLAAPAGAPEAPAAPALPRLQPRQPGLPVVLLYTLQGQAHNDEARADLAGWRDALGFEVDEQPLELAEAVRRERYQHHAPVAFFDGQELFNFKMDENLLKVRLQAWRERGGR